MNPVTKTATMPDGNVAPLMITLFFIAAAVLVIFLLVLAVRALLKHTRKGSAQEEEPTVIQELSASLKKHRIKNGMTPEAVAKALGVSRQTVSKWESGATVPSSADLFALAKLYKITPAELLSSNKR